MEDLRRPVIISGVKTIIFFRHGKSDWAAEFDTDSERPVSKRGIEAAKLMGRFLGETGQRPDKVITSSAVRARTTAEIAHRTGSWDCSIRSTDALYAAEPAQVLSEIRAEPDSTGTLVVVGHEPTWSETIGLLLGRATLRFPTAAMARIDFDVQSWGEIDAGRGMLVFLVAPKLLGKFVEGST